MLVRRALLVSATLTSLSHAISLAAPSRNASAQEERVGEIGPDLQEKPVLATILLNPEHEERLREVEILSPRKVEGLLDLALEEARWIDNLVQRSNANLRELPSGLARRRSVQISDYEAEVAALTASSRSGLAELLDAREAELFLTWLDEAWSLDRARARRDEDEAGLRYTVFLTQYFGYSNYEIAIPDKYLKFANLGWEYHPGYEDPPYNVTLRYEGRTVTAVGVLDVGPWNIDDNYCNAANQAERPRRLFTDLPRGMPEAQAAYYNGYNGGRDQYGRTVLNPGACDVTPEVASDLGLAYLQNAWVEVEYLWEGEEGAEWVFDNPTARTRGEWILGSSSNDKYGSSYIWSPTEPGGTRVAYWAVDIASAGSYELYAWWPQGSNRSHQARLGTRIGGVIHSVVVDQRSGGGQWNYLGTYNYPQGRSLIGVSNDAPAGAVVLADAMRLVER
ncbi:MAG: hypothetical protein CME06_14170 [Gemmatimonadetes bacterium]|nr:hypothetical protein [Gemmatimonadota bacterium]